MDTFQALQSLDSSIYGTGSITLSCILSGEMNRMRPANRIGSAPLLNTPFHCGALLFEATKIEMMVVYQTQRLVYGLSASAR